MVKQLLSPLVLLLMLMSFANMALAEELKVEPDRTQLYEGEVLTLTVTGTMKLDINLSNLFNFDLSNLPAPDIENVEPDFEILARNQRYSIRTVDSEMMGEITWTYQLAPKKTGKLTIPPLTFRDATSKPVTIEVVRGNPPGLGKATRDSFIELAADKAEVYVQEQLILTVRLFFSGNLIRGELSEPQHPNAIIEPLGKQQEFSRYRDGVRYRVVERRYAVFPQKPGNLALPAIRFEGQARDANGKLIFLRDSEQLFDVPVNDVPAEFTGNTWLPATRLSIDESGLPPSMQVETGENLSRKLILSAAGLPSEALPPLPDDTPKGLRSYPEQPERSTQVTSDGLNSTLSQTTALVPVKPGDMTLPEIRIPWWNTKTDSQEIAVIPARSLQVSGLTTPDTEETAQASAPLARPETNTREPDSPIVESSSATWQWLALAVTALWLFTLAGWWWTRRKPGRATPTDDLSGNAREKDVFEKLIYAAREGSPSTSGLLTQWMNQRFPGHQFLSANDALDFCGDPELEAELGKLQQRLFSSSAGRDQAWDGRALAKALQRIRRQETAKPSEPGLPPLYPGNLSA
ncbi:hypothetical protein BKP64_03055 [Marinobacter salinus]|uniref:DUF7939 domain-containing protein n=1 Tax=Marinobacter salinus TaxID=1874317 RepID=A0A1D9GI85_9GAMM|nr:BatD family protein [Marinobacter salinus]AOY87244.1 hypothetical protein BKP64_03055 [Marinobacter salinus]